MKKKFSLITFCFFFSLQLHSQQNCNNPFQVTICPSVYLSNQTNAGMGDDAPASCNSAGEDVVYELYAPNGAHVVFVSVVNASAPMLLSLEQNGCDTGMCNAIAIPAGDTNVAFNVSSAAYYYVWVDAPDTVTYDISFGADTGSVFINIPDTQGDLQFDSSGCATPMFSSTKPFFKVSYNSVFQTNPMTLAPLLITGTMCITTYFKNTTGVEAVKKFSFHFDSAGYSFVAADTPVVSGFYRAGNWVASHVDTIWTFEFFDQLGTGEGDFSFIPDTCLAYTFCFDVIPISNDPQFTSVDVRIISDGFGAGFTGMISTGCCPAPNNNCLLAAVGNGNNAHAFGYGFADPGIGLPIVLIAFDAKPHKDYVLVSWMTASEINNDFYSVERSLNGFEWTEIGRVDGAGNSTVQLSYQYVDEDPVIGISFYRLKQTDYDGHFAYSPVKEVRMKDADAISVFPNPATRELKIKNAELKIARTRITIFSPVGEKLLTPVSVKPGEIILDISSLPRGFYLLVIEENGMVVKREKIVLQN